ncbi:hypothetical protein [Pseudomonas sp. H2_D07]
MGVLQAPVEAGQVQQDQARAGRQPVGCRQVFEGGKGDAVFRALRGQGVGKGLHAGSVVGGGQQDVGAPRGRGQQQAGEQHGASPQRMDKEEGHP